MVKLSYTALCRCTPCIGFGLTSRKKQTRHQDAYQSTTTSFPTNRPRVRSDSSSSCVEISITGGGGSSSRISSSDGRKPHIILGVVLRLGERLRNQVKLFDCAARTIGLCPKSLPACFLATKEGTGQPTWKAADVARNMTKRKALIGIECIDIRMNMSGVLRRGQRWRRDGGCN